MFVWKSCFLFPILILTRLRKGSNESPDLSYVFLVFLLCHNEYLLPSNEVVFSVMSISQSFSPKEDVGGPCTGPQPPLYKALDHPPSVQLPSEQHVQTCLTWTSLYWVQPPTSTMFRLVYCEALIVGSGRLAFD